VEYKVVKDVVDVLHGSGEPLPFLAVVHQQIVIHLAFGLLAELLHVILQKVAQSGVQLLADKVGPRVASRLSSRRGTRGGAIIVYISVGRHWIQCSSIQ